MDANIDALHDIADDMSADDYSERAECIRDAIAEIERLRAQNVGGDVGWQPIETAPKDGTWILGHIAGRKLEATIPFRWSQRQFERFGNGWDFRGNGMLIPTHWRPLPDAPKSGSECGAPSAAEDNLEASQALT